MFKKKDILKDVGTTDTILSDKKLNPLSKPAGALQMVGAGASWGGGEAGLLRFTMQLGEAQGAITTPTGLTYWNHGKSYLNQQSQGNINSKDTELAKSLVYGSYLSSNFRQPFFSSSTSFTHVRVYPLMMLCGGDHNCRTVSHLVLRAKG